MFLGLLLSVLVSLWAKANEKEAHACQLDAVQLSSLSLSSSSSASSHYQHHYHYSNEFCNIIDKRNSLNTSVGVCVCVYCICLFVCVCLYAVQRVTE